MLACGTPNRSRMVACSSWRLANNVVRELDKDGKAVWTHVCKQPYDAERLVNGNTLIAEFANKVVEVDSGGKVVWSFEAGALDADRLVDGNTLIADYKGNRFVEVSPDGEVVWLVEASRAIRSRAAGQRQHTVGHER